MKNKTLRYIMLSVAFILISIITFITPIQKSAVFWIGYAFTFIAFISQVLIWRIAFKKTETLKSKFLGFPIVYIGITYLILQTLAFSIFLFIPLVSIWVIILVYVLILGLSILSLITTELSRTEILRVEQKIQDKTFYIKKLQVDVELIAKKCDEKDCQESLAILIDKIRYSDPMTNTNLEDLEMEIKRKINELKSQCEVHQILDIQELIEERNKKCKILK